MTTTIPKLANAISSGNGEIDKKMGGGIPVGSLSLIEGQSDAGKSVLSQHLAYGALLSEVAVAYYTTENTVKSLISQMGSLNLGVIDHFLVDRLRVYPLQIAARWMSASPSSKDVPNWPSSPNQPRGSLPALPVYEDRPPIEGQSDREERPPTWVWCSAV